MARISVVEAQNATPEVKEIYSKIGNPINFHKALAHRPEILKGLIAFYPAVGKNLDKRLYELVYIRVSMINGCNYCMQHHVSSSKRAGLSSEDWKSLKNPSAGAFSDKEKAALAFAEKLTRTPQAIGDADISTLKKFFSDAEIMELDLLVGVINMTNRFTEPLGLELEMAAVHI